MIAALRYSERGTVSGASLKHARRGQTNRAAAPPVGRFSNGDKEFSQPKKQIGEYCFRAPVNIPFQVHQATPEYCAAPSSKAHAPFGAICRTAGSALCLQRQSTVSLDPLKA